MTKTLRCLVIDIETWPLSAHVWQLKDQYVDLKQMTEDWSVAAWSAKWLDDPPSKLVYRSTEGQRNLRDDRRIMRDLWNLINQADVVITQNGMAFDCPKITARFILHGMKPPRPYRHIDTYKLARRIAAFTSNSLEYLTKRLCKRYKKLSHRRFPGLALWSECLKGNAKAWREMREYNIHDVLSTEELYLKLRAWAPESTPTPFLIESKSTLCAICGVTGRMTRRGVAVKSKLKYQRWQCQTCGRWSTGKQVK